MNRYHVVGRTNEAGQRVASLVRGIPLEAWPDDPKKDRTDGIALIEGVNAPGSQFWADVLAGDFVWTGNFKRYWEHNPVLAARIREGAGF